MGKSGGKWPKVGEKWGIVGKSEKSGKMWLKVAKSG